MKNIGLQTFKTKQTWKNERFWVGMYGYDNSQDEVPFDYRWITDPSNQSECRPIPTCPITVLGCDIHVICHKDELRHITLLVRNFTLIAVHDGFQCWATFLSRWQCDPLKIQNGTRYFIASYGFYRQSSVRFFIKAKWGFHNQKSKFQGLSTWSCLFPRECDISIPIWISSTLRSHCT